MRLPLSNENTELSNPIDYNSFKESVLNDYYIAHYSRQASLIGRKEVLSGKAKFGIFGDGKEVAQLAMAKVFRNGDFRSGYYRDQTFMFAAGMLTLEQFFAQLYAHPDIQAEPSSAGRAMNGHYSTRLIDDKGNWLSHTDKKNSSADISPTAGQMPRLLGLAYASKLYRQNKDLSQSKFKGFSFNGNEVAFGTIGDASCAEGLFFETMNAAGVMQVPMAVSVWDDGFGISVPNTYQITKQNISELLEGFSRSDEKQGILIFTAKGWDYPGLIEMYEKGIKVCREEHVPVLFHIQEVTQPQGHSTSGSHERYKSSDRLKWEEEHDCIAMMRKWILSTALANEEELIEIENKALDFAKTSKKNSWNAFLSSIKTEANQAKTFVQNIVQNNSNGVFINKMIEDLPDSFNYERKEISSFVQSVLRMLRYDRSTEVIQLRNWFVQWQSKNEELYNSHLYSQSELALKNHSPIQPIYKENSEWVDGREILLNNYDKLFSQIPELIVFGEDVGQIGGVNQSHAGLQEKFGELRIHDTGIREATIVGQGIGLALRGLRPVAEIQYLDYLAYAIQVLSDDLATLQYRTKGGQKAPLIISTRGHRLEGIWHSGSPMQFILGALRGIHVLVPRDMTRAAGFYNALLKSDEPALVIEPLNGYRIKEQLPENLGSFTTPIGVPEILKEGTDITIVTYGSCCRIVMEAVNELSKYNVSVEVIDVQSLIPFDVHHHISESIHKTNNVLFVDEDVPGGATAYMMQQVIEEQGMFEWLETPPSTLTSKPHRPAYGTDGDYFSKPSVDDVFNSVYNIMHQIAPDEFPVLFR